MEQKEVRGMPEYAFEVLPNGKEYTPYIPADQVIPEVTARAIILGMIMAVVFSAAAAFLGLKIGQVFEAAIPIAIIAVGVGPLFGRRSTILENVIIQSIGAASGLIVAGAIFTLPALFILKLDRHLGSYGMALLKISITSFLGASLGILFLIPFRRYFVKEMHGQFPFPEATATTQILVAGEKGGAQARVLMISILIGGLYDFCVHTFGIWSEVFTTRIVGIGQILYEKYKIVLKFNSLSAIMGLGYIIGLRYTMIIAAGSLLSWIILIPLASNFGGSLPSVFIAKETAISAMNADDIFFNYVRFIGIGAIAMAGIIGIIRSYKIVYQAFGMGFRQIFSKGGAKTDKTPRTDRDLSMKNVMLLLAITTILILLFFRFFILQDRNSSLKISLIATVTVFVISFLFTSVAARAIAIVGTNPVSGMTMMTLIISSLVLVAAGLSGEFGMISGLLIGGVVCTALSMAGGFITDLKIGYWLGSTPVKQQAFKYLGVALSAVSVALVIFLLNKTYGFDPNMPGSLTAPQANAMAALIQPLMNPGAQNPWWLYGFGAILALIMTVLKIPALAFALGMYIPIQLNTPLAIGGLIAFLINRSSKDKALVEKRNEKGILIASGFIAGGALIGVVSSLLKLIKFEDIVRLNWADRDNLGQPLALAMFVLICVYLYFESRRVKE